MVPFIGLIGKTEETRTCLGHKSFCRCSKVLGKCSNHPWKSRFLQAQIFHKYISYASEQTLGNSFTSNIQQLSALCPSNISQWISKKIVNWQWQCQGVRAQDEFFPCRSSAMSLLTPKKYFLSIKKYFLSNFFCTTSQISAVIVYACASLKQELPKGRNSLILLFPTA